MEPLAGVANPFRETIVRDPWQASEIDVPEIHATAFETCCAAMEEVRAEGRSTSVLLHGEAGSGKTHLLARLRRHWAGPPPRHIDPIRPEVVFIAVRLQTGPQRLWRYLRRSFVEDLLRTGADGAPQEDLLRTGADGSTQLVRILLRRLAEIRSADADLELWWEWLNHEYPNPTEFEHVLDYLFD